MPRAVWHQHQPYYPDDVARENPMPWERSTASRDHGMALISSKCQMRQQSISRQLLPQASPSAGAGSFLDVARACRRPERGRLAFLLDHFFMCNLHEMIGSYPRTPSCFTAAHRTAYRPGAPRPSTTRTCDLQVWYNLTWIILAPERDRPARLGRGRNHRGRRNGPGQAARILRQVIPLSEAGRVRPGGADDDAVLPPDPAIAV